MGNWVRKAETFDALSSLAGRVINWLPIIIGSASSGGLAVWAAIATNWLTKFGPIVWYGSGACGVLLFLLAYMLWGKARLYFTRLRLLKDLALNGTPINPLDQSFTRQKIELTHFTRPYATETIDGKTFVDCDLLGPAVILLVGRATLVNVVFRNCDFVKVDDEASIHNVMVWSDLTLRGGHLYNTTILVPASQVNDIPSTANWITRNVTG